MYNDNMYNDNTYSDNINNDNMYNNSVYGDFMSDNNSDMGALYSYDDWEDDYQPPAGSGLAVAGMTLGIVSFAILFLISCCFPALGCIGSFPFAVAGLIFSIIGLKKGQSKGMCVTGIVCSALALLASIMMFALILLYMLAWGATEIF